jgi:hypothetical protein
LKKIRNENFAGLKIRGVVERTAPTPLRSAYFEISAPPLRSAPHISARTAPPLRKKFGGF